MRVGVGLADLDPASLAALTAEEAVRLFQRLFWCAARRASVPITSITISARVDVADGGVDAEIDPNQLTPKEDLLAAGNSSFQIKAGGSAAPWQKGWIEKELFGKKRKLNKAGLGPSIRRCLGKKGRYVLVCFGSDPTGPQRKKAIANLQEAFRLCGYKNPQVDVWGQSTLTALMQPFPSIRLALLDRGHLPFLTFDDW